MKNLILIFTLFFSLGSAQVVQLIDSNTKQNVNFERINALPAGSVLDGVLYARKGSNLYKRLIENNEINVKQYGLKGDGSNEYQLLKKVIDIARNEKINLYFPAGVYSSGISNFPIQKPYVEGESELKSYNNIIIRGDGRKTVFKSKSVRGADVLQLNSVRDLTIKDIAITAEIENKYYVEGLYNQGSNGISITHGFDNLHFENIYIFDLPGVEYSDYIDGGKAITIQSMEGDLHKNGTLTVKNCVSYNNAYGFRFDGNLSDINKNAINLFVDMYIEKSWVGYSMTFNSLTSSQNVNVPQNYNVNVTLKDVQKDITLNRVNGGQFNFRVLSSQNNADLKLNRFGVAWRNPALSDLFDTKTHVAYIGNLKNASVSVNGFKPANIRFLLGTVGSIDEPFFTPQTENVSLNLNVLGAVYDSDITISEYLGKSIEKSYINIQNLENPIPVVNLATVNTVFVDNIKK